MITWRMSIALTSLVSCLCTCQILTLHAQHVTLNKAGVVNAREWDFSKRLPLTGEWTFVENKILAPDSPAPQNGRPLLFPSLWNDMRPGGRGTGCATYGLTIIVPKGVRDWIFEIPPLNNSYNLWVNGIRIAYAGVVSDKSGEARPQWIYQLGKFSTDADTLKIVLQIGNGP